MQKQICGTCGIEKDETEFYPQTNGKIRKACKLCDKERIKKWREGWTKEKTEENLVRCRKWYHKPEVRNKDLIEKYGITLEQYNAMWQKQNGLCKLCGRPESRKDRVLSVDHNHKTGKVRALLCSTCNINLGYFENHDLIEKIKEYLKEL